MRIGKILRSLSSCLARGVILAWLLAPYQAYPDSFSHDWGEQLPKPLRTVAFNLDIDADSDVRKIVDELGIEALCLQQLQKQLDDVAAGVRVVPYSQIALGSGSLDIDSDSTAYAYYLVTLKKWQSAASGTEVILGVVQLTLQSPGQRISPIPSFPRIETFEAPLERAALGRAIEIAVNAHIEHAIFFPIKRSLKNR